MVYSCTRRAHDIAVVAVFVLYVNCKYLFIFSHQVGVRKTKSSAWVPLRPTPGCIKKEPTWGLGSKTPTRTVFPNAPKSGSSVARRTSTTVTPSTSTTTTSGSAPTKRRHVGSGPGGSTGWVRLCTVARSISTTKTTCTG